MIQALTSLTRESTPRTTGNGNFTLLRFDISGLWLPFNWTDDDSILATRQDARGEDETFAK